MITVGSIIVRSIIVGSIIVGSSDSSTLGIYLEIFFGAN